MKDDHRRRLKPSADEWAGASSVLVVDDDPMFCEVVREILRLHGIEVHMSYSAEDAMWVMTSVTPDLILTDIMMPEVDGVEFVQRVRAQPAWSAIPTVLVSAKPRREVATAAAAAGADGYLSKPFSIKELRETVAPYLSVLAN